MYELWQNFGTEELGIACALASEHGAYGSDYLVGLLRNPRKRPLLCSIELEGIPEQNEVDRTLALYETYAQGGVC
jgi:hypothetical protein